MTRYSTLLQQGVLGNPETTYGKDLVAQAAPVVYDVWLMFVVFERIVAFGGGKSRW